MQQFHLQRERNSMKNNIKVLLVDDHTVVRAGFRMLLSSHDAIGEITEVERGELACQLYGTIKPDVVVMDLSMPGIGGLETIRRINQNHENAAILVYSIHDEMIYVERALQAGAKGYVSKNSAADVLAEAVIEIANGESYIEENLLPEMSDVRETSPTLIREKLDTLSPREFDIFCLLANGLTAHDIAQQLCLGYKTIANYSTQIKQKLNASNAADLARMAIILGIIKTE